MSEVAMRRRYRLGIDIGGTFTDLVLLDEAERKIEIGKLLTTPKDLSKGVLFIFERMLQEKGINPRQIQSAIHGTTVATNAVIERKGAKSGLLTAVSYILSPFSPKGGRFTPG